MGLKRINVCKAELIGREVRLVRKHLSQPRAPALTQCCLLRQRTNLLLCLLDVFPTPRFLVPIDSIHLYSSQTVKNLPAIRETQV